VRFATDVGDTNPLHHDDAYARGSRFGTLIASGTQTVAYLMALCGAQAQPDRPGVGLEFSFQLRGPAKVDEEILMRWTILGSERSDRPRGTLVTLRGEALGEAGNPILIASAKTLFFDPD